MIVSVAFNPSVDKLAVVDRVTPGSIHRPDRVVTVPGGKGLNAARAAAALGAEVTVAAFFGGFSGRWVYEQLLAEGLRVRPLWSESETRTSLSVYARDQGTLTEFYEPGSPLRPEEWDGLLPEASASFAEGGWVLLSGSLPPATDARSIRSFVDEAHRVGCRVAVDLRGPALAAALDSSPDLVKVNRSEAAGACETVGAEGHPRTRPADLARLLQAGVRDRVVVVTAGVEGAAIHWGERVWTGFVDEIGPYPVGSGDAFLGGMVAALDAGGDLVAAFRLGIGAAVANAHRAGAGRLDPDRARETARKVRLTQEEPGE